MRAVATFSALLLSFSSLTAAVPAPAHPHSQAQPKRAPHFVRRTPVPSTDVTTPLEVASHYSSVSRVKANGGSAKARSVVRRIKDYGKKKLSDIEGEAEWAIEISFGGEKKLVILDTGSSDTWLAQEGFQCVSRKLVNRNESACAFGSLYNGNFNKKKEFPDENFNITYGDGEFLTGNLGYLDVTVAGLTVKDQEVALVNRAYWRGDGLTSGLMGLAYSSLTSAYIGTNPTLDNFNNTGSANGDQYPYSPVVQTMISQGLSPALFSLALERSSTVADDSPGGYIAFGGLPPISLNPVFASTPIEIFEWYEYPTFESKALSFYTIAPQAYVYAAAPGGTAVAHNTSINAIVDSGTTLLYVPSDVAAGYVASFSPAATELDGNYYYPCNATAPYFGVSIAGTTFEISSADILLPDSGFTEGGVTYCLVGVIDGGSGVEAFPIFGDVFLKNVVAVFDIAASMLRFAPHVY